MKRTNKVGDWQELVVLSFNDITKDTVSGDDLRGPAVKVTFARFGREVRFSHTPGVLDQDGVFRPVQHLHHRDLEAYIFLLKYTEATVVIARDVGPEMLANLSHSLKKKLREAHRELSNQVVSEKVKKVEKKQESSSKSLTNPTFGTSIGEMVKAKKNR